MRARCWTEGFGQRFWFEPSRLPLDEYEQVTQRQQAQMHLEATNPSGPSSTWALFPEGTSSPRNSRLHPPLWDLIFPKRFVTLQITKAIL